MRTDGCPREGVAGLFELFLWLGNRVIELGDRKMEPEPCVLAQDRYCGLTERPGNEGRRILLDPEGRLLLDGGLTRTVGGVLLPPGVLTEGWLGLLCIVGVLGRGRWITLGGLPLDLC